MSIHTHTHTRVQVIYTAGEGLDAVTSRMNVDDALRRAEKTTLTQFFSNNQYEWGLRNQENSRTPRPRGYELTYGEYPKFYRWDKATKTWLRRKRYGRHGASGYIGRMRFIPPTQEARRTFYLRLLLHVTVGPLCFKDLKRVDGVIHDTYKEACFARGVSSLNSTTT